MCLTTVPLLNTAPCNFVINISSQIQNLVLKIIDREQTITFWRSFFIFFSQMFYFAKMIAICRRCTSRIALQISSPSAHGFMIVPGFKLSLLNTYPCIENSKNLQSRFQFDRGFLLQLRYSCLCGQKKICIQKFSGRFPGFFWSPGRESVSFIFREKSKGKIQRTRDVA